VLCPGTATVEAHALAAAQGGHRAASSSRGGLVAPAASRAAIRWRFSPAGTPPGQERGREGRTRQGATPAGEEASGIEKKRREGEEEAEAGIPAIQSAFVTAQKLVKYNNILTEGISNTPNKKSTRCCSLRQQGSSAKIIDSSHNMQEVQS